MIFEGKVVIIDRDNVDTATLYPGAYLNIDDPEEMKLYLFEGLNPSLRNQLGDENVLVVGENFGSGSLREHVVQGMKAWNIQCVLGKIRPQLHKSRPAHHYAGGGGGRSYVGVGGPDGHRRRGDSGEQRTVRDCSRPV